MTDAILALCGAFAVLFSLMALFQRSLFSAALCVLIVLLQAAAVFFLVGAQLLAWIQALVYAGAVMILLVVAAISSPPGARGPWAAPGSAGASWLSWLGGAALLGQALAFAALAASRVEPVWPAAGLERQMAAALFGPYALLTEAAGVLILLSSLAILGEPREGRGREVP